MCFRRWDLQTVRSSVVLIVLIAMACPAWAGGSDVRFGGTVAGVEQTSDTEATVTIELQSFDVPILVNGDTEIESHGDEVGLEGLMAGAFVKVSGFFSPEGITAEEIDILDSGGGEFRLIGEISVAGPVSDGTLITLLGVDVLVNEETVIEQRGSDEAVTPDDLAEGMFADARGIFDDPQLVATRLKIGTRDSEAPVVEFEGTIVSFDESMVLVDTGGGGSAIVLLTDSTTIIGELAEGKFAEVRGTFNEALAVVDAVIKVDDDGDGDADDDNGGNDSGEGDDEGERRLSKRSTRLDPSDGVGFDGETETEFLETPSGEQTQELEVSFHNAERRGQYRIRVTFASETVVDFGIVDANGGGRVKVKFRSDGGGQTPNILGLLPEGETVQDVRKIEVLNLDDEVLMTAVFD